MQPFEVWSGCEDRNYVFDKRVKRKKQKIVGGRINERNKKKIVGTGTGC